jgi:hypothetical protein
MHIYILMILCASISHTCDKLITHMDIVNFAAISQATMNIYVYIY